MPEGAEIWFYHLERSSVEETLPPLVEKCLDRNWRAEICSPAAERLTAIDTLLWTYKAASWLPHCQSDAPDAHRTPIVFGAVPQGGCDALFLLDRAQWSELSQISRIFVLFDGRDEDAVRHARADWRKAKDAGLVPTYWRQNEDGKWAKSG